MARPSPPAYLFVAVMMLSQCCVPAPAGEPGPQAREGENQPPVLVGNIPLQNFPEDNLGNKGYRLVNLSKYFSDDGGGENIAYSVVFATDPTHICATVDGQYLSFTAPTKGWYGQERFRVRATDSEGLWTESNDFTVRVTPGPSQLKFKALPEIDVETQSDWFFDLDGFLSDPYGFEGLNLSANSSFFRIDGLRLCINYSVYYEQVPFIDSVLLNASGPSGTAEAVISVRVWQRGHFWNPFEKPRLIEMFQDENYSLDLSAAVMSNETPIPRLTWKAIAGTNGSSPLLSHSVQNNTTVVIVPARHQSGNGTVFLTATDGKGWTMTCCLPVQVIPVFSPERIIMTRNWTVNQSESASLHLTVDDPNDDLVFWTNSTLLYIDKNGVVHYGNGKTGQEDVGIWRVAFRVSWVHDPGVSVRWNVSLSVLNVNDPPDTALIVEPRARKFISGYNISFECMARDIDGDRLNCTWFSDGREFARGIAVRYSGLPIGTHGILANVSDGEYSMTSQLITVTIVPGPPDENADRPDYAVVVGILAVVCLLAVAMVAVVSRSNEKN